MAGMETLRMETLCIPNFFFAVAPNEYLGPESEETDIHSQIRLLESTPLENPISVHLRLARFSLENPLRHMCCISCTGTTPIMFLACRFCFGAPSVRAVVIIRQVGVGVLFCRCCGCLTEEAYIT